MVWTNRIAMLSLFLASTFSLPAHADTYKVFSLGSDNARNLAGIDDAGNAVVSINCPTGPSFACYDIYVDGVFSSQTTDLSGFHYTKGGGKLDPAAKSLLGSEYLFIVNAEGDIAWIDTVHEEIMEAIDLTSRSQVTSLRSLAITSHQNPEPSTFILFGTGLLGIFGVVRGRWSARPSS